MYQKNISVPTSCAADPTGTNSTTRRQKECNDAARCQGVTTLTQLCTRQKDMSLMLLEEAAEVHHKELKPIIEHLRAEDKQQPSTHDLESYTCLLYTSQSQRD